MQGQQFGDGNAAGAATKVRGTARG